MGVLSIEEANSKAKEKDLDLLLISETATPPVCKLVNYGQFMYHQKKKDKQAKRSAQVSKELKLSPKISDNDYNVRLTAGKKFLGKNYKVKLTVMFRGREVVHKELGIALIERFIADVIDLGTADKDYSKTGRMITVNITPK